MSSNSVNKRPILIVGMHRSGTTLVSHLLNRFSQVHFEMEPQVIWKAGNFHYLADTSFDMKREAISWIRSKLLGAAGNRLLIEKSPTNCIRPQLVHAVFPEARIVYVERDPVRCIYSNLQKTLLQVSFDPAILFGKYLFPVYSNNSNNKPGANGKKSLDHPLKATGGRRIHSQLRSQDLPSFFDYVIKMLYIRNVLHALPFGPKLDGFVDIMRNEGPLAYHVKLYKEVQTFKSVFKDLYGDNFELFKLEEIHTNVDEIHRLYDFCGFDVDSDYVQSIFDSFNPTIINHAHESSKYDEDIKRMLELS